MNDRLDEKSDMMRAIQVDDANIISLLKEQLELMNNKVKQLEEIAETERIERGKLRKDKENAEEKYNDKHK